MADEIYTIEALSTGGGRNGRVTTSDGMLDLVMAVPIAMGGSGAGSNPEQLFAAGYAACYHSALQAVARSEKISITDSSVGSRVSVVKDGEASIKLKVDLEVVIPELDAATAARLSQAAHAMCPYSRATAGNIDVTITVAES